MRIFLSGVSSCIGSHLLQSLLLRDKVQKIYSSLADLVTLKMGELLNILLFFRSFTKTCC